VNVTVPPTFPVWSVGCVLIVGPAQASPMTHPPYPIVLLLPVAVTEMLRLPVAPAETLSQEDVWMAVVLALAPPRLLVNVPGEPVGAAKTLSELLKSVSSTATTRRSSPPAAVPPVSVAVNGVVFPESTFVC